MRKLILALLLLATPASAQTYQWTSAAQTSIQRSTDGAVIPVDPRNADYQRVIASGVTISAYVAPTLTLAQQAQAALAACSFTITSTGTPALSASYPCDAATQSKLGAVVTTITATGGFPGGAQTYPMKDSAGAWHSLTPTQYVQIAGEIAAYVGALDLIADGNPGGATALPNNAGTIP